MIKIASIKETCIYVKDLKQTRNFYHSKLGLPIISLVEDRHIFFRAGNSVLLCFITETTMEENILPPHGATGIVHFAFEVNPTHYDEALQTIRDLDIPIQHEQTWKGNLRSFYFSDPDNNLVEIIEAGVWDE